MLKVAFVVAPVFLFLSVSVPAYAQGRGGVPMPIDGADEDRERLRKTDNRLNLRIGTASSDSNHRPTVCLEVRALARLSVEGCGTGSGFLHNAEGGELAHFRAKWALSRGVIAGGLWRAQLGVGFAELQLGADNPGFVLRPSGGVEATGPEASASAQWLKPVTGGWEMLVSLSAGMAWVPGAGELQVAQDTLQPFVAFEVGAGW
jgi:hypothetical protein